MPGRISGARRLVLDLTPAAAVDVARIEAAWTDARKRFGAGGAFLFGAFSAADAMFAPVVTRLHIYDVPVKRPIRAYMDAVLSLPAYIAWVKDAHARGVAPCLKFEV